MISGELIEHLPLSQVNKKAVQGASGTCQCVILLSFQERLSAFESPEVHRFKSLGASTLKSPRDVLRRVKERLLFR